MDFWLNPSTSTFKLWRKPDRAKSAKQPYMRAIFRQKLRNSQDYLLYRLYSHVEVKHESLNHSNSCCLSRNRDVQTWTVLRLAQLVQLDRHNFDNRLQIINVFIKQKNSKNQFEGAQYTEPKTVLSTLNISNHRPHEMIE
jgi:hypothetical protein